MTAPTTESGTPTVTQATAATDERSEETPLIEADHRIVTAKEIEAGAEEVDKDASAGLVGEYFSFPSVNDFPDTSKAKPALVRVDRQIDFDPVDGEFYGPIRADKITVSFSSIVTNR